MGFTDRDWGDTGYVRRPRPPRPPRAPRARRRSPSDSVGEPIEWVGRQRLAEWVVADATAMALTRRLLSDRLDRYCGELGMVVDTVRWTSWPVDGEPAVDLQLTAKVRPRTDGVWGEVRAALAEDQADRAAARWAPWWDRSVTPPPTDGS